MIAVFSVVKLFFFGLLSLISIILGAILYPFRINEVMMLIMRKFWSPVVLKLLGVKVKIEGFDKVDKNANYLIMANHNSFVDIPVLSHSLPFNTFFIAKQELGKVPLLGWYIRASGMILIDRSNRIKANQSIALAANYIGNGKVVIIFPEGTKSKDGNIAIFKKGGFHLAQQAQTQILPIKIKGAREVWPNKRPFCLRRGVIKLIIGTPIQPKELQSMEIGAQAEHVRSIITNL